MALTVEAAVIRSGLFYGGVEMNEGKMTRRCMLISCVKRLCDVL